LRTGAILNSIDPDLHPFKLRGKLIQYVGWSDSAISPLNDINYYTAVTDVMGGPECTRDFYRMFMFPAWSIAAADPAPTPSGTQRMARPPPIPHTTCCRRSTTKSSLEPHLTRSSRPNTSTVIPRRASPSSDRCAHFQ
jgi:hypothetical protein